MTTTITIENVGSFKILTSEVHTILSFVQAAAQRAQQVTQNQQIQVQSAYTPNDGRSLING
jgi:hypothetical protein